MHEWYVPPASHEFTPKTICSQGRDRLAKPARALILLSVSLFVVGVLTVKLTLVCRISSTDELSPKKPNNTNVMVAAMKGLVSPSNSTNYPQFIISSLQRNAVISKVPLKESNEYHEGIHDMQDNFRTARVEIDANKIPSSHRKVKHRMLKRKRRSVTVPVSSTTRPEILETTDGALTNTAIPMSSYGTTVPLGASYVTPTNMNSQMSSLGSTNNHRTDTTDYSTTLSTHTRPTSSTTQRLQPVTPRPPISTTIPSSSTASAPLTEPLKLTHEVPVATGDITTVFPSTLANVYDQHTTDTISIKQTQRGPEDDMVTRDISTVSGTTTSDVTLGTATSATESIAANPTSPMMSSLQGPPKANSASQVATTQGYKVHTYTSFVTLQTSPSILVIMPVCVGLALLGLMGAGVKRCLLYRRLGRAVELKRGSQVIQDDKGYTIENPMPKSRRSYIERQVANTLNQVNKPESSSKNSINNAAKNTKVCMEIATVSSGSVGMPSGSLSVPAGSLRRTASERLAPSRRHSFLRDCRCYCHCPLCGQREGVKVKNGSSTTGTATTRL